MDSTYIITTESTMGEIRSLEEFRKHEWMVSFYEDEREEQARRIRLSSLPIIYPDWNPESIAKGLNYLRQKAQKGDIFKEIWSDAEVGEQPSRKKAGLIALPQKGKKFVILLAGGGYESVCSLVEAFPVAQRLEQMGYGSFIVRYRVGEDGRVPHPMEDMAAAIRYIFEHQKELGVDTTDYAIAGFSAGGHLAATIGIEPVKSICRKIYPQLSLPAVLFLAYPVITMGNKTHPGSRANLLGEHADDLEYRMNYSIEERVEADYPPVYIWQCAQDHEVLTDNSIMLVEQLENFGVKHRFDIFPGSAHGWGLADGTAAEGWLFRAERFWKACRTTETFRKENRMSLKFDRIHHVAIIASDYQKSRHFYVDLLGFEVIRENYREERNDYKLDLRLGDCELELFGIPNSPARPNYPEACGLRHLAFAVDNIEDTVAQLNALGIDMEPVRRDTYTDKKMTFFKDPDGLPLELHE